MAAKPNEKEIEQGKALLSAVNDGDMKALKKILGKSPSVASLNYVNNGGTTPLIGAAQRFKEKDSLDMVTMLLESAGSGINVNFQNKQGMTALHFVAKKGYAEVIDVLLNAGAEFEMKNDEGLTPMELATHKDATKILNRKVKERRAAEKHASIVSTTTHLVELMKAGDMDAIRELIGQKPYVETYTHSLDKVHILTIIVMYFIPHSSKSTSIHLIN